MTRMLAGKAALVTGGSRGLGAAIAALLAAQGADVAISYVSAADKAAAVVKKLDGMGVRALAVRSDQADLATARPLVEQVIAGLGRLDILVANAAIAVQGRTVDDPAFDDVAHDRQWQVNVMGPVAITRAAAPRLTDGGRIILIGSLLGSHVPFPGVADYAGTKAALAGYARGVARDLGPRNITVNIVQPGIMPTDMAASVAGDLPDHDRILDLHTIRRIATVEEVADTVGFLAGPSAGYITGQAINVAGGLGA